MHGKNPNLHGSAPDSASKALLIIDMLVDFKAIGDAGIERRALRVARNIARLRERATSQGIPTVFVNDNAGRWQSDRQHIVEFARHKLQSKVAELLAPAATDYFVIKAKHSGFFGTALELLLTHLGARTLILTGATDVQCVLFTGIDAFIRDYSLYVPSDCLVTSNASSSRLATGMFKNVLHAHMTPSTRLSLRAERKRKPA